jgi:hypothetical protein
MENKTLYFHEQPVHYKIATKTWTLLPTGKSRPWLELCGMLLQPNRCLKKKNFVKQGYCKWTITITWTKTISVGAGEYKKQQSPQIHTNKSTQMHQTCIPNNPPPPPISCVNRHKAHKIKSAEDTNKTPTLKQFTKAHKPFSGALTAKIQKERR